MTFPFWYSPRMSIWPYKSIDKRVKLNLPASISGSASKLPLQSVVARSANNDGIMQWLGVLYFLFILLLQQFLPNVSLLWPNCVN